MNKALAVAALLALAATLAFTTKWTHRKHQRNALINEMVAEISAEEVELRNLLSQNEVKAILAQPFYFIGKGKQVAAFKSHDGRYVIKCLLHNKLKVGKLTTSLSGKLWNDKKSVRKELKLKKLRQSFMLALQQVPEETGMLYLHLHKTAGLPQLMLVDERGHIWSLDANNLEFALQKRAELVKPTLIGLMYEGKVDEARQKLTAIFELLVQLAKKGIRDTDGALIRNNNLGFVDGKAILIDTGKLIPAGEERSFARDLKRVKPLRKWLEKHYPTLGNHFCKEQDRVLYASVT